MAFLCNHESTSKKILLLYWVIGSIFSDFYKQIEEKKYPSILNKCDLVTPAVSCQQKSDLQLFLVQSVFIS